jgi:oxalate decarboxylase
MSDQNQEKTILDGVSRRSFLGVGSAALATVAMAGIAVQAQQREDTAKAESDHSSNDPGPENRSLLEMNPNTNTPPPTDHGDIGPIWYSFDLHASVLKRVAGPIR